MKKLLVLGGGTAGTMIVNRLRPRLDRTEWEITVVDRDETHYYQPGFLFIPFGGYTRTDVVKPRRRLFGPGISFHLAEIDRVEPEHDQVHLAGGEVLDYDVLVIATGTHPRPDMTPGLQGGGNGETVHDFYTIEGAEALAASLSSWEGGRLVVEVVEMPIKCPVAPLEFALLADSYFTRKGIRDDVELVYVTPLSGAFTRPIASEHLDGLLEQRGIAIEPDFYLERVDQERRVLVSFDDREVAYDLLVTVPVNAGADFVARSGLGDELNHVPVDKHTFLSTGYDNVFAIGDAAALPTSKAGSTAHFSVDVFVDNFLRHVAGLPMTESFDGHANCFIESGAGKGLLIDFDYEREPLPGRYPLPRLGPFPLLKESRLNHWGKRAFKWVYWNVLMRGRRLPVPGRRRPGSVRKVQSSTSTSSAASTTSPGGGNDTDIGR